MPTKLFCNPTNLPYIQKAVDPSSTDIDLGGDVVMMTAGMTLLYGDAVFMLPGGRVYKSLEASVYPALFIGFVVGGQSNTNMEASSDSALIGTTMATVGQKVLVQVNGVCYGIVDATGIKLGDPLVAGSTTAGRVLGGAVSSYAAISAGLAIKAGGSALVKAVNILGTAHRIHSGAAAATATAANLDMAALSGTTANGQFAIYVFRVASDGTTVTSAKSADAASLAAMLWPTAGSYALATLGGVIINPTGTGDFVGGTTALDDATVVPNAKYVNLVARKPYIGISLQAGGAAATACKLLIA